MTQWHNERGVGDDVDMLAQAREAQWSAETFLGPDTIKIVAPAKVNLFLGIGSRMSDGYHELNTVFHALSLHDVLYMCRTQLERGEAAEKRVKPAGSGAALDNIALAGPAKNIEVRIDMSDKAGAATGEGGIRIADNLVFKAIDALAHEIGWVRDERIDVRVEKHIPMQSGLGGGSADAAAALLGAAHLWGISESGETLRKVAAGLGADVAFFLKGGCGFFTGKGERLEHDIAPMKLPVVLVRPGTGVSTAEAYAAFDEAPVTIPAELIAGVENASAAQEVPLYNNLTAAAEKLVPELADVRQWLAGREGVLAQGGEEPSVGCGGGCCACDAGLSETEGMELPRKAVLLSGSGSAVFAVVESYSDAMRIAAEAQAKGWWARATTFSSLRATVV